MLLNVKVFNEGEDILEKAYDDGDISRRVFDEGEDILENFLMIIMTYLTEFV